jgi:CubicO group peptidase (beta-lactamase class C family)
MTVTTSGPWAPDSPASRASQPHPEPLGGMPRIRRARVLRTALAGLLVASLVGMATAASASGTPGAAPSGAGQDHRSPETFGVIDHDVALGMARTHLPGLTLGIVKGDRVVHIKAFGEAGDRGQAARAETPFYIGSNSKSFTALAVMQLVEAGRVDLNAPVQRYIPWFRIADRAAARAITIRMLLNQTSGLGDWERYFWPADGTSTALADAVRSMGGLKLRHAVGTTFEYASVNFTILGQVVAMVSGQSYENYVQRHILTPLDMTHTYLDLASARRHGLATQHRYWFDRPFTGGGLPYNRAVTPAGLIMSTAPDMSHYLIAQLNGGRYGGHRILSAEGIAHLHRGTAAIGGTDSYAMGWVASTGVDGKRFVWHGGDTGGSHAYMAVLPHTAWGVVVLTNGSNDLRPNGQDFIAQGVMARLLGHQPYTPPGLLAQPYTLVLLAILTGGLLQIAGIARTLVLWRRWSRSATRRPRTRRQVLIRVGAPFALNAGWAALLLVVLPALLGLPLFMFVHPFSDWGTTDVSLGAVAVAWGMVLRPAATLLVLRKSAARASRRLRSTSLTTTAVSQPRMASSMPPRR